MVDRAVEGVGCPDRGVKCAAGHRVRAEEDVEGVPEDEGERDQEPDYEGAVGGVDVAGDAGGGGGGGAGARGGFG